MAPEVNRAHASRRPSAAGILLEQIATKQGSEEIAGYELAAIIDHEEAIAVTIECKAGIGMFGDHAALKLGAVLGLQWVEPVVGQAAIGIEV